VGQDGAHSQLKKRQDKQRHGEKLSHRKKHRENIGIWKKEYSQVPLRRAH